MDTADLVLLHGSGGTGKTSLLLGWSAARQGQGHGQGQGQRPVAWLTVDVLDNDPARFWAHLAAALALALGELTVGEVAAGGVTVDGLASGESAAELRPGSELFVLALAERIVASGRRPVLVLDEFEQLTDAVLHRQFELLLRGCADRLTTVLSGRVPPSLRPAGLAVAALGPAELRMDRREAGRLLAGGGELRLSEQRVAALVRSTGGWVGALIPAATRLRPDSGAPLRGVGPEDGLPASGAVLAEQLLAQVWSALDPGLHEFLLDTAVLERFGVELAGAVHPGGDATKLIARLRRGGIFLASEQDGWFRYQRLLRWALAGRLAAHDPARERLAHRAAACWHLAAGHREQAVDHALRAGDQAFAVELIGPLFEPLLAAGRPGTLERWLGALSNEAIAAAEAPFADRASALWSALGRPDERDRWARAAGHRAGPRGPRLAAQAWQLCLPREAGDLDRALRQGRAALDRKDDGWAAGATPARVRLSLARTLLLAGHPVECGELAAEVLAEVPALVQGEVPGEETLAQDGELLRRLHAHALLGLAAWRTGEHAVARAQAELARAVRAGCPAPPRARAVPEYLVLRAALAQPSAAPEAAEAAETAELAELVDGSPGLGPDRSLTVFAQLVLALRQPARAAGRLAAADAALAGLRSALGLADFRAEVAAAVGPPAPGAAPAPGPVLTDRELAVLRLLRADLSPKEIADRLYISLNTVRTHARNAHRKL